MDIFSFAFALGLFVFALVYIIILKPLVPLLILKFQHGKDVKLMFFPILGVKHWIKKNTLENVHPYKYLHDYAKENPNLKAILTNQLFTPCVLFCQPQLWKPIVQDHDHFLRFNLLPMNNLLSKGLVFSQGELWKKQRKLLSGAFTFDQLMKKVPTINQISMAEIDALGPNEDFDCLDFTIKIAGEIIIRTFFGSSFGESIINGRNASMELQDLINKSSMLYNNQFFLLKYAILDKRAIYHFQSEEEKNLLKRVDIVRSKASQVIKSRIKQWEQNKQCYVRDQNQDFLDVYLNENVITPELEEEMIHQFITFFFAGTDTTAHLLLHMLYYLSINPEMQEDVRTEVKELRPQGFNSETLKKYKKIQALINESLRMQMFGEGSFRRHATIGIKVQGITIKKGWLVGQYAMFYQRTSTHWIDPSVFNINRWLNNDDNELNNDPLKFAPFLAFGRNCIGQHLAQMEAKIIVSNILSKFKVIPSEIPPKIVLNFLLDFADNRIVRMVPLND